jgi:hypothetical protein
VYRAGRLELPGDRRLGRRPARLDDAGVPGVPCERGPLAGEFDRLLGVCRVVAQVETA